MRPKNKTHDNRAHAPLPPSASGRWLRCAPSQGYIKALIKQKTIKKRESGPAAQRGTRIHEIAEPWLKALIAAKKYKPAAKADKGEVAEAKAYVDYCMARWNMALDLDAKATCGVEVRSKVTADCWGSCDFWIFAAKTFTSIDLKSGREGVEADDNTQLLIYALGVIREKKLVARLVELCIWQPNADSSRPERLATLKQTEFVAKAKEIDAGIAEATRYLDPDIDDLQTYTARLVPGEWCGYCDALGVCPKARERSLAIATKNFKPVTIDRVEPPAPSALEPDQVAEIMRRAPMFTAWLEAVHVRALELMHKGARVPGYKVVPKITRRAWESKYTDAQIAKRLGVSVGDITETKRLSPSKVEENLSKAQKLKLIGLVFKPPGEPTVVADKDRREALPSAKISFKPVSREEEVE